MSSTLQGMANTEMNKILISWVFYLIEEGPSIKTYVTYVHADRCTYRDTDMNAAERHKQSREMGSDGGRGCS